MSRLLALLLLAACASFPEVDSRVSERAKAAEYPTLLSLDAIAARSAGVTIDERTSQSVLARVARLEARARLMRGAPVDEDTRLRLAALAAR